MLKQPAKQLIILLFPIMFASLSLAQTTIDETDPIQQKIENGVYKQITSVLVNHKGKRVYESYFGDGSPDKLNDIRSASKTFTSLAMGLAIAKNHIPSVDTQVLNYLPEYASHQNPFSAKHDMTFIDLLTMTSPLECNDWNSFSLGNEERMYLQADWARFILDLPERGIPPWETPAEQRFNKKAYSYCTGGVFITGKAIESATGVRTDRFLQDNLFNFMDIKTLVWPMSPKGHAQTGGGVKITSPDLLKIGQLLLDKGRWQEKQFIPAQWIKEMKQPYVEIDPERNIKYGYLLWIYEYNINKDIVNNKTVTAWAASGNGGNYLWFVPQLDLTAVVTSTAYNQSYMHRQSQEIFEKHILPMAALAKVSLKSE